ncbi:hypothetical protein CTT30_06380 [Vibrio coralliilyticus]|nr:hypothetical protein CTT30_06380 [Vibrio coralliilyticus]
MHNKAFKSDSQRLAFSLRSSMAKRRSHLNAALGCFGFERFVVWRSATSIILFVANLSGHVARTFSGESFIQLASFDVSGRVFSVFSALGRACSLKVRYLNLVSFFVSANHRKNSGGVVIQARWLLRCSWLWCFMV